MIRIASVHTILQRLLRKRLLCTHHGILSAHYSSQSAQRNITRNITRNTPHATLRHLCNITDNTAIPQRLGAISSEMVWFFTPPRRHPDQDRNMCRSAPCTKRCQLTTFFKSIGQDKWPFPANSSESRRCQLTTKCTLQQHAHIHISPVNSTPPQKKQGGGGF